MRKTIKRPDIIKINELYEILDNEIGKYDIRENGALEKKWL